MSADNYIGIWYVKKTGMYYGYDLCASCDEPKRRPKYSPSFKAISVEEAALKAEKEYTEYGYHFMNLVKKMYKK